MDGKYLSFVLLPFVITVISGLLETSQVTEHASNLQSSTTSTQLATQSLTCLSSPASLCISTEQLPLSASALNTVNAVDIPKTLFTVTPTVNGTGSTAPSLKSDILQTSISIPVSIATSSYVPAVSSESVISKQVAPQTSSHVQDVSKMASSVAPDVTQLVQTSKPSVIFMSSTLTPETIAPSSAFTASSVLVVTTVPSSSATFSLTGTTTTTQTTTPKATQTTTPEATQTTTPEAAKPPQPSGLTSGAKAALGICIPVMILLVAAGIYVFVKHRQNFRAGGWRAWYSGSSYASFKDNEYDELGL